MKQQFILLLLLAFCVTSYAQPTILNQKTLGGYYDDMAGASWPTTDGGVVLGGRSYSPISGEKNRN